VLELVLVLLLVRPTKFCLCTCGKDCPWIITCDCTLVISLLLLNACKFCCGLGWIGRGGCEVGGDGLAVAMLGGCWDRLGGLEDPEKYLLGMFVGLPG